MPKNSLCIVNIINEIAINIHDFFCFGIIIVVVIVDVIPHTPKKEKKNYWKKKLHQTLPPQSFKAIQFEFKIKRI